jgi:hypothetical protein
LKTIKESRKEGIAKFEDEPGGIFVIMFKLMMSGLFNNKKVNWMMVA